MLTYPIDEVKNESMYEYLYRCIKEDILNRTLEADQKLPSKRTFAKHLKVSVITIENAYAQLLVEGYIYSVEKKGYFVAKISDQVMPTKEMTRSEREVQQMQQEEESLFVDFASNRVSSAQFPFSIWTKLQREVIGNVSSEAMLTAAPVGGVWELRNAIAEHLRQFRGMNVAAEQIVVGAGTEYLYHILIQLLGRDAVYAVEEPGFTKITKIYESNGVTCAHIPLDHAGVQMQELEESGADILHISPSHHFPTGIVMPISRRYELLGWAAKGEMRYIIEDDYDCEFRLNTKPIPTLQSIDVMEKVIYVNTFSKSLAPSFRISYMVLPKHLVELYDQKLGFYSCTVSTFEQYTLAAFLERGYFEKHINRMRNYYRGKRDLIMKAFEESKLASRIEIREEDAGLHFLLVVDTELEDEVVMEKSKERGIGLCSLSRYYYRKEVASEHVFVVNYSAVEDERVAEAIERLEEVFCDGEMYDC